MFTALINQIISKFKIVKLPFSYKQLLLSAIPALLAGACKKIEMPNQTPLIISDAKATSIKKLRVLGTATAITLPDGLQINGVVISDAGGKNIAPKTLVLQGLFADTAGIIISFDTIPGFQAGDNLTINAGGLPLKQQNGELTLLGVTLSKVTKTMGGVNITPRPISVKEALNNAVSWNGTLVSFYEGAFSGGGKYTAGINFKETDSTATIKLQVLPGASFENTVYPQNLNGLTGILRMNGSEPYIEVRNTGDVQNAAVTSYLVDDLSGLSAGLQYSTFSKPGIFSGGILETKVRMYSSGANLWGFIKPFKEDASFLTNKSWLYFFDAYSRWSQGLLSIGGSNFKGIKEIRVTFASSKVEGFITEDQYENPYNAYPFNPLTDKIQLQLAGSREDTSAAFSEQGRFYTVTFHVPGRSELIKAAMAQYGDSWPDYADYTIQQIDKLMALPQFTLKNASTRLSDNDASLAPIIISQIEYGF